MSEEDNWIIMPYKQHAPQPPEVLVFSVGVDEGLMDAALFTGKPRVHIQGEKYDSSRDMSVGDGHCVIMESPCSKSRISNQVTMIFGETLGHYRVRLQSGHCRME